MQSIAEKLIHFYTTLVPPAGLPGGTQILFPFNEPGVQDTVKTFFYRYFNDNRPRKLILGINPGRFGAGTTGINFTAPRQLKNECGIEHAFKDQSELSAEFIYQVVNRYGGAKIFYQNYLIGSVSPLGFVRDGININYYDKPALLKSLKPFIVHYLLQLLAIGFTRTTCICIGGDKNYSFLSKLNDEHQFFENIVPLPHPRFIMQYKRRQLPAYLDMYLQALETL